MAKLDSMKSSFWVKVQPEILEIPVVTPSNYIQILLLSWDCDENKKDLLCASADVALQDFYKGKSSNLLFDAMTLAVCSMITALVMFKIKSTHFFTTIPANFLNGNVEDFDMCINIFHKNCEDRNCRIKAYKNSFTYRREVDLDAFFEDDSIKSN